MHETNDKKKVLDCQASDNVYLHKDFHGALCYGIKYLGDNFGPEGTVKYLEQVGRSFFLPLITQLREQGLPALEKHWRNIFTQDEGKFKLEYDGDILVLTVEECPAIAHLKKNNQLFTDKYCETTVVVNRTICGQAGYDCSCEYQGGEGKCVQKFWKIKE